MELLGIIASFGYYAVRNLRAGNRDTVSRDEQLEAEVETAKGEILKGHHSGERKRSVSKRSYKSLRTTYTWTPYGNGEFHSHDLQYKGNFTEGKFNDMTDEALCFMRDANTGEMQRFKGSFKEGRRHGYGELELYSSEHNKHYIYFKGLWRADKPYNGDFFNFAREKVGQLRDGEPVVAPRASPARRGGGKRTAAAGTGAARAPPVELGTGVRDKVGGRSQVVSPSPTPVVDLLSTDNPKQNHRNHPVPALGSPADDSFNANITPGHPGGTHYRPTGPPASGQPWQPNLRSGVEQPPGPPPQQGWPQASQIKASPPPRQSGGVPPAPQQGGAPSAQPLLGGRGSAVGGPPRPTTLAPASNLPHDPSPPPPGPVSRSPSGGPYRRLPADPEDHPLIKGKKETPDKELSFEDSIELLSVCLEYGEREEGRVEGKEALVFIGNTGAGKSTLANYIAGCKLVMKKPKEAGVAGFGRVAVVVPPEEGGTLAEVMRIGHSKFSQTFIPGIAEANGMILVDCPGFLDNRGPEINIANAVNIRRHILKASKLKFIILVNFYSLGADRARGLRDLMAICTKLFGSEQNLKDNIHSVLLGITRVSQDTGIDDLREFLLESPTNDIVELFAQRLFVYDPEDQGRPDGAWGRAQLLRQVQAMPGITGARAQIFKTVMADSELQYLQRVGDDQVQWAGPALERGDFGEVAARLARLRGLSVIDHPALCRALDRVGFAVARHGLKLRDFTRGNCVLERFDAAKVALGSLKLMQQVLCSFVDEENQVDTDGLEEFLAASRAKAQRHQEQAAQLQRLMGEVARLNGLVRQLEEARAAAKEQKRRFEVWTAGLAREQEAGRAAHQRILEDLRREMREALARKDEEVARAFQLGGEGAAEERRREQEALEQEYLVQLLAAEDERKRLEQEHARERQRRERFHREQEEKAQRRIRELEQAKLQAEEERERSRAAAPGKVSERRKEERTPVVRDGGLDARRAHDYQPFLSVASEDSRGGQRPSGSGQGGDENRSPEDPHGEVLAHTNGEWKPTYWVFQRSSRALSLYQSEEQQLRFGEVVHVELITHNHRCSAIKRNRYRGHGYLLEFALDDVSTRKLTRKLFASPVGCEGLLRALRYCILSAIENEI